MIWGYRFEEIEAHLSRLGFRRVRIVSGNILFVRGEDVFTIREPNVLGSLPETRVQDAFYEAGLEPPPQAASYVD